MGSGESGVGAGGEGRKAGEDGEGWRGREVWMIGGNLDGGARLFQKETRIMKGRVWEDFLFSFSLRREWEVGGV